MNIITKRLKTKNKRKPNINFKNFPLCSKDIFDSSSQAGQNSKSFFTYSKIQTNCTNDSINSKSLKDTTSHNPQTSLYNKKRVPRIKTLYPIGTVPYNIIEINKTGINSSIINKAIREIFKDNKTYHSYLKNYNSYKNEIPNEIIEVKEKEENNIIKVKNNELKMSLKNDLKNKLEFPFNIVKPEKFNKEFRIYADKEENEKKENGNLENINNTLEKKYGIKKITFNTLNLLNKQNKFSKGILILDKFKRILIRAASELKRINATKEEFFTHYLPHPPFYQKETSYMIHLIQKGMTERVTYIIKKNKYTLLDYDLLRQTPLIWAAKKNCYDLIPPMISNGACVSAADITGKTALHYAVQYNNIGSIMILLYEMASPFLLDHSGKSAKNYAISEKAKYMIKRACQLHILYKFGNQWNFCLKVRKGLKFMYEYELHIPFEEKAFNIASQN